jgi:hypothetical protein
MAQEHAPSRIERLVVGCWLASPWLLAGLLTLGLWWGGITPEMLAWINCFLALVIVYKLWLVDFMDVDDTEE